MIAYGICIGPSQNYETICRPSLPPGAFVRERRNQASIFSAYNSILDEVLAAEPEVEAVVLVHDDVALGAQFESEVRVALETGAGIVGSIGAIRPPSIAWWEGAARGRVVESGKTIDYGAGTYEVDTVDGLVMVLARACAMKIRFDSRTYHGFHGYDADYCYEAKRAGFRVIVAPLTLVHHTKASRGDPIAWRAADLAWQRKWGITSRPTLTLRYARLTAYRLRHAMNGLK